MCRVWSPALNDWAYSDVVALEMNASKPLRQGAASSYTFVEHDCQLYLHMVAYGLIVAVAVPTAVQWFGTLSACFIERSAQFFVSSLAWAQCNFPTLVLKQNAIVLAS